MNKDIKEWMCCGGGGGEDRIGEGFLFFHKTVKQKKQDRKKVNKQTNKQNSVHSKTCQICSFIWNQQQIMKRHEKYVKVKSSRVITKWN